MKLIKESNKLLILSLVLNLQIIFSEIRKLYILNYSYVATSVKVVRIVL